MSQFVLGRNFKIGDRVVQLNGNRRRATVVKSTRLPDNFAIRFDDEDYGTATNCHSNFEYYDFALEILLTSPLYQELA